MGYLAILIKGTKIEIKTHQNFLSRLLVLFMVYALSISGLFSVILASFGFTRVPSLSKPSFCYATLVNLGDLCSKWQNQCTLWRLSDRSSGKRARTTQRCLLRFSIFVILSRACKLVVISWWLWLRLFRTLSTSMKAIMSKIQSPSASACIGTV